MQKQTNISKLELWFALWPTRNELTECTLDRTGCPLTPTIPLIALEMRLRNLLFIFFIVQLGWMGCAMPPCTSHALEWKSASVYLNDAHVRMCAHVCSTPQLGRITANLNGIFVQKSIFSKDFSKCLCWCCRLCPLWTRLQQKVLLFGRNKPAKNPLWERF